MKRLTLDEIVDKEFTIEARGYSVKEVNDFLNEICDELELLQQEKTEMQQRNACVSQQDPAVRPASSVGEASVDNFREILEMAQKVKEETIRKANEDAEMIRAEAQEKADERLASLEDEKKSLERQVEELKKAAAVYRASFESLLQAQQEALEKASDLF